MGELSAEEFVREHLVGVLPPGVPPSFSDLTNAEFRRSHGMRTAVAGVTFIDGGEAVVQVFEWKSGMKGHRWLSWHGADLYWDGDTWRRAAGTEGRR